MDFNKTATHLANAGSRALGALRNKIYSLKNVGFRTYTKLYHSGVTPILDYCSGIWGYRTFKCIDDIQNRALRYFMGVHRFCPLPILEGDMGWKSSVVRRHIEIMRLWNRILDMPDTRLPKITLNYDLEMCMQVTNWMVELQDICRQINWENSVINWAKIDIRMASNNLSSKQLVLWNKTRHQKPKLRYYNLYKAEIETEYYIFANLNKRVRATYAQFRAGILPLAIETGRFQNIDLNNRLCMLCNETGERIIEDEFHFLCECKLYNYERSKLFRNVSQKFPDFDIIDKFIFLNINAKTQTASFIDKAFTIRKRTLYR
jgi:hypothetical protein